MSSSLSVVTTHFRCFQNFTVRYYNYTADQYENFVDFQAKYL